MTDKQSNAHTQPERDASSSAAPRWRSISRVALPLLALAIFAGAAVFAVPRLRGQGDAPPARSARDVPQLEGGTIAFSPAFVARAGIKATRVTRAPLTPVLQVVGTVTFDEGHVAAAGTRVRGFVRKVHKVEGDQVKQGELLAEIESADLGNAQTDVAAVRANRNAAELNARREKELLVRSFTTAREEEVARAQLAEQEARLSAALQRVAAFGGHPTGPLGTYRVCAPIGGTIVKRSIAAGQSVEPDVVAFRVADLYHLWVELRVFEREIGHIRKDDVVEISPTGSEQGIRGNVAYVGEIIDPDTRNAEVRVHVDNDTGLLRPGQSVVARIRAAGLVKDALSVPTSAITSVDGKPTVFALEGETRVRVVEVQLGRMDGERQEVVSGLKEGELVVNEGVFALKSELFR